MASESRHTISDRSKDKAASNKREVTATWNKKIWNKITQRDGVLGKIGGPEKSTVALGVSLIGNKNYSDATNVASIERLLTSFGAGAYVVVYGDANLPDTVAIEIITAAIQKRKKINIEGVEIEIPETGIEAFLKSDKLQNLTKKIKENAFGRLNGIASGLKAKSFYLSESNSDIQKRYEEILDSAYQDGETKYRQTYDEKGGNVAYYRSLLESSDNYLKSKGLKSSNAYGTAMGYVIKYLSAELSRIFAIVVETHTNFFAYPGQHPTCFYTAWDIVKPQIKKDLEVSGVDVDTLFHPLKINIACKSPKSSKEKEISYRSIMPRAATVTTTVSNEEEAEEGLISGQHIVESDSRSKRSSGYSSDGSNVSTSTSTTSSSEECLSDSSSNCSGESGTSSPLRERAVKDLESMTLLDIGSGEPLSTKTIKTARASGRRAVSLTDVGLGGSDDEDAGFEQRPRAFSTDSASSTSRITFALGGNDMSHEYEQHNSWDLDPQKTYEESASEESASAFAESDEEKTLDALAAVILRVCKRDPRCGPVLATAMVRAYAVQGRNGVAQTHTGTLANGGITHTLLSRGNSSEKTSARSLSSRSTKDGFVNGSSSSRAAANHLAPPPSGTLPKPISVIVTSPPENSGSSSLTKSR